MSIVACASCSDKKVSSADDRDAPGYEPDMMTT
jgi:hypothetical protein